MLISVTFDFVFVGFKSGKREYSLFKFHDDRVSLSVSSGSKEPIASFVLLFQIKNLVFDRFLGMDF